MSNDEISKATGTLLVTVNVNNDQGTQVKASDYNFAVNGINPFPQTFPGTETLSSIILGQGSYSIRIEAAPKVIYILNSDSDCSGTISNGQIKKCVLNIKIAGECPPGYHFN
jgi:hypothetical protein